VRQSPARAMTNAATRTLKVQFEGEFRRLQHAEIPSVDGLQDSICNLFQLPVAPLAMKYRDDENDLCILAEETLADALALSEASGVLTLFCSRTSAPAVTDRAVTDSAVPAESTASDWSIAPDPAIADASAVPEPSEPSPAEAVVAQAAEVSRGASHLATESDVPGARVEDAVAPAVGTSGDAAPFATEPIDEDTRQALLLSLQDENAPLDEETRQAMIKSVEAQPVAPPAQDGRLARLRRGFRSARGEIESKVEDVVGQVSERVQPHLQRAQPHVEPYSGGFSRFGREVTGDFRRARDNMQGAFQPSSRGQGDESAALGPVGHVVSGLAGVLTVVRMTPIRAAQLAATSASTAVRGGGQAQEQAQEHAQEPAQEQSQEQAQEQATTVAEEAPTDEFSNFKEQVIGDFKIAQEGVHDVLHTLSGPEPDWGVQATRVGQLVAGVAGVTVSTTLVPLHVARMAVAKAAQAVAVRRGYHEAAHVTDASQPTGSAQESLIPATGEGQ